MLDEQVYMTQPQGYMDPLPRHFVCCLNKPIYGLKQAFRMWYRRLTDYLLGLRFKGSTVDASLFIRFANGVVLFVLMYVNDILATDSNFKAIHDLLNNLNQIFVMKDLSPPHYFLGIEVHRTQTSLYLHQSKYIYDLPCRSKMVGALQMPSMENFLSKMGIRYLILLNFEV